MLNWRENGSHVEKAFNLGEPPLVPLSPYPPLISLIIPPKAGRLWRFLMNPLCPVSVQQDWQARYTLTKWAGNNQSTIRRGYSLVRDGMGERRGEERTGWDGWEKTPRCCEGERNKQTNAQKQCVLFVMLLCVFQRWCFNMMLYSLLSIYCN